MVLCMCKYIIDLLKINKEENNMATKSRGNSALQQGGKKISNAANAGDWVKNGSGGGALGNPRNNTNNGDTGRNPGKS